jgi:putative acetyltransferase
VIGRHSGPERRLSIREASGDRHVANARALFIEYRDWLATHREVTSFPDAVLDTGLALLDKEIEGLPGEYVRPAGALLVAYHGRTPVGCAALRPQGPGTAEFKRLYVRPALRGSGVGRRLTVRAVDGARELGYRRLVLDTLPGMGPAIALYRALGFRPIAPYWAHPVAGALFFEFSLRPRRGRTNLSAGPG